MSLDEVLLYIDARKERETLDYKTQLMYDYTLARNVAAFVAYSFNGKQIPSFEELYPDVARDLGITKENESWESYKARFMKFAITRNELLERGKK